MPILRKILSKEWQGSDLKNFVPGSELIERLKGKEDYGHLFNF
jgi:hypothetical protein